MSRKSKQKRQEQERTWRRAAFTSQSTNVVRGEVTYRHLGARRVLQQRGNNTIYGKFFDPRHVVFLNSDKACGHCPVALICRAERVWESLRTQWEFFICDRCKTIAFVDRKTVSNTAILYVCTRLRGNRQAVPWNNTHKERQRAQDIIDTISGVVFSWENNLFFEGDIPFACAARCRNCYGELQVSTLNEHVDCRTTIQNAVRGRVVSY